MNGHNIGFGLEKRILAFEIHTSSEYFFIKRKRSISFYVNPYSAGSEFIYLANSVYPDQRYTLFVMYVGASCKTFVSTFMNIKGTLPE